VSERLASDAPGRVKKYSDAERVEKISFDSANSNAPPAWFTDLRDFASRHALRNFVFDLFNSDRQSVAVAINVKFFTGT